MKKVLVALQMSRSSGQRKLSGIYRYLNDHPRWQIQLIESSYELTAPVVRSAISDGADGIILSLSGPEDAYKLLSNTDVPKIVMDIYDPIFSTGPTTNSSFVYISSRAIAHAAFEHFFNQRRFRSYVFVPATENLQWSKERGECFAQFAAQHGIACNYYSGNIDLTSYLRALPPPVAVFTATDLRASEILQAASIARLSVPKRIAVIGVDDSDLICENAVPRLSSIRPDFEEEGFQAAAQLDRMMEHFARNRKPTTKPQVTFIETASITSRESSAEQTSSGRLVDRAVHYIRENATKGICVADVVRKMHVSRRLLYLRFAEQRGEKIHALITRHRLDAVKRLLVSSKLSTSAIAECCGFPNDNVLRNLFKRTEGVSMSSYRANFNAQNSPLRH